MSLVNLERALPFPPTRTVLDSAVADTMPQDSSYSSAYVRVVTGPCPFGTGTGDNLARCTSGLPLFGIPCIRSTCTVLIGVNHLSFSAFLPRRTRTPCHRKHRRTASIAVSVYFLVLCNQALSDTCLGGSFSVVRLYLLHIMCSYSISVQLHILQYFGLGVVGWCPLAILVLVSLALSNGPWLPPYDAQESCLLQPVRYA